METFDVVVIGAGPGGYPAAIRAAQLGAKVALVEKEYFGGTCLNWGCIPTKALIASGSLVHQAAHADALGLQPGRLGFDYTELVARKNRVVDKLRGGVAQLLRGNKVAVFKGVASFLSRNRIAICDNGNENVIQTAKTIIATGSESVVPGFLPEHERVVDSRAFLDRTELPSSMIVLGGGFIGCEFACLAAQLGVEVTVVELLEDIIANADKDVRGALRRHMESVLGVRVLTGNPLENVDAAEDGVRGSVGGTEIRAELLLVAVGRKPVTDGLALENAGIKTDDSRFIPVDEYLQTRAATVFAIGDVTGGPQLAHAATSQGITAAENAHGNARRKTETLVPACMFTAPEIGAVGLTEQDAAERGIAVRVGKFAFSGLGKAIAVGDTTGFVKWVAAADTGQLLGAHAVGPHATELVAEAALAIRAELTAHEVGTTIHSHPTFAEAWMEAAHALDGQSIHQPSRK